MSLLEAPASILPPGPALPPLLPLPPLAPSSCHVSTTWHCLQEASPDLFFRGSCLSLLHQTVSQTPGSASHHFWTPQGLAHWGHRGQLIKAGREEAKRSRAYSQEVRARRWSCVCGPTCGQPPPPPTHTHPQEPVFALGHGLRDQRLESGFYGERLLAGVKGQLLIFIAGRRR